MKNRMLTDIFTIAGKDLQVLFRDKGALAVLFLLPLCFATIFGGPASIASSSADPDKESPLVVSAYIVNLDSGPYGEQVVRALAGISILDLEEIDDAKTADKLVADGESAGAILIPESFSRDIDDGTPTQIRLITDPTQEEAGGIIGGILNRAVSEVDTLGELKLGIRSVLEQSEGWEDASPEAQNAAKAQTLGVIWTQVQQMRSDPLIAVRSESSEGAEVSSTWNPFTYYAPSFGVMFAFFLVGFMAESFLLDKETGMFQRVLIAPVHASSIIAGKILSHAGIVFLQILLLFGVGTLFFNMPLGSSPVGVILTTLALSMAATSLGMMIGSLAKSSKQAGNLGTLLGFILMILGGCIFPLFRQGGIISVISYLTPHAHAINAYMRMTSDGMLLSDIYPHILALLGFAVVFFSISLRRMYRV